MDNKEGKIQEFVGLLTLYQGKIYSYILSMVPSFTDAADIMQETSKMMWVKFNDFRAGTDFLSWGLTIAHYRILEYRNAKKRQKEFCFSEPLFDQLHQEAAKHQDQSQNYLNYLKKCFYKLRDMDQRLILMRYHENHRIKEIASRFGKSIQSIYRDLGRIQNSLLACIKKSMSFEERGI